MEPQLQRIAVSNRTPFEKKVVSTNAHLPTSPRAVGNALRRNPFAPQVPCHRIVTTGGALGGCKGVLSRKGKSNGDGNGNGEGEDKGEETALDKKQWLLRANEYGVENRGTEERIKKR
ncbi:methylated-DNA--cysteine S-met [Hypoxylon sp. NC1633]|nr:methylated-DNA--cysteine S-met [Hypoxylon sp. NC1633]